VTVQTNTVEVISSSGATTTETGALGQVYAGVVNGAVIAPEVAQQTYQNQPYNPFNLMNLDVSSGVDPPAPPPPPPPPPSPPPPPPPPRPAPLAAPTGMTVRQAGANQIDVSWNGSEGANHYMVERSVTGGSWVVVAPNVTTTFFVDAGLAYSTNYRYFVVAVASSGATAQSSVVTAETGRQPDVLSAAVSALRLNRRVLFSGAVASFTDANTTTSASQFVATIKWGDGHSSLATISGGGGSFVVDSSHAYRKNGRYTVSVMVTMPDSSSAGADASAAAVVTIPPKHQARVRVIHRPVKKRAKPAKERRG
jgi:hypothetical protein